MPKPEDKYYDDERVEVVSNRVVYKNSISFSQMQALSVPGPIVTELVHNSYPLTVLKTGTSAIILILGKQPQVLHVTEHHKESMTGKS